jgi:hypothetical protein
MRLGVVDLGPPHRSSSANPQNGIRPAVASLSVYPQLQIAAAYRLHRPLAQNLSQCPLPNANRPRQWSSDSISHARRRALTVPILYTRLLSFLYWTNEDELHSPLAGSLRFRITRCADPKSFESGRDLTRRSNRDWKIIQAQVPNIQQPYLHYKAEVHSV